MANILVEKFREIQGILKNLTVKEVVLLGTMSMMRTYNILNILSTQEGLNIINKFTTVDDIILSIVLDDEKDKISVLERFPPICEELIPVLEEYNQNSLPEDMSNIMDCKYSLIEKWYYFTDFDYINFREDKKSSFATFVIVGLEAIEQYLSSKYCFIKQIKERQVIIENNILFDNEIDRINQDILFLKSNVNSNNIRIYMNKYKNIDIFK